MLRLFDEHCLRASLSSLVVDNNNKGKAETELRKSVHRVLLVALETADERLLTLITMLEGCNYEGTFCYLLGIHRVL